MLSKIQTEIPGAVKEYSYEIIDGKPELKDLPASFANEDSTKTLKVVMKDKRTGLKVELLYSVFEKTDIITRSVNVINEGKTPLYIEKVMSACFDIEDEGFEAFVKYHLATCERTDLLGASSHLVDILEK